MKRILMMAVVALCLGMAGVAGANLVTNGDFETGDLSGWTFTPASSGSWLVVWDGWGVGGSYGALFGAENFPEIDDTISQTIPTVPGKSYVFDFMLSNPLYVTPSHFAASWNGTTVLDLINAPNFDWTYYSYGFVAPSSTTTISFAGWNPNYAYALDNVDVHDAPIPGALVLLGSGLLPFLGWRRARKN